MIKQDTTALLETLAEVVDVYFGPEAWDRAPGGAFCGEYAAYYHLKMSDADSKGMAIGFANEHAKAYWSAIGGTKFYADFDFVTGVEIDPDMDWPSRAESDFNLRAAQHIQTTGIFEFRMAFINDLKTPYRGIEFTSLKTGDSYTFREDKDIRMFESAYVAYRKRIDDQTIESTQAQLDRFVSGSAAS